jgi:hypothetical protein
VQVVDPEVSRQALAGRAQSIEDAMPCGRFRKHFTADYASAVGGRGMTEGQWLACPVAGPMLAFLRGKGHEPKLLRFVAACLRRHPRLLASRPRRVLDVVERRAEGELVAPAEWTAACQLPFGACDAAAAIGDQASTAASRAAQEAGDHAGRAWAAEQWRQADLLRCLFGNPFRPVAVDPVWLAWRERTVVRLAQAIDADHALDRLPILADALEEAGCTDAHVLGHCRGGGKHAPGCWVLNTLLGREPITEPWTPSPDGSRLCPCCGAGVAAAHSLAPVRPDCPGCALGPDYWLVRPIARGYGGEVWHARDPGGHDVAVKFIPLLRDLGDNPIHPAIEAGRLLPGLRHPSLLQTFLCRVAAGHLLLVTELADSSLDDRLRECRRQGQPGIPAAELLGYVRQAAEALDYLHGQGVLHLGVRPSNVLLAGNGHVRVAEVGLDRVRRPGFEGTLAGGVSIYATPEFWRAQPCPASDQFALALTYGKLRADRRPFAGRTLVEEMRNIVEGRPDLDWLPAAEQRVVHKALATDPARRFPDCRAFASALAAATGHPPAPVPARTGPFGRLASLWRTLRREERSRGEGE